jgi:hypothetical protein
MLSLRSTNQYLNLREETIKLFRINPKDWFNETPIRASQLQNFHFTSHIRINTYHFI